MRVLSALLYATLAGLLLAGSAQKFFVDVIVVSGESMEPAYHSGDFVWIEKISLQDKNFCHRNKTVVFDTGGSLRIKIIRACPGDTVRLKPHSLDVNGVTIQSWKKNIIRQKNPGWISFPENTEWPFPPHWEKIAVPENACFVTGENADASIDSRHRGLLPCKQLRGVVFFPTQ